MLSKQQMRFNFPNLHVWFHAEIEVDLHYWFENARCEYS